jgi:hypothetical protein
MAKIATAHQPNYMPWIGLFSKIKKTDCFVIADTFALGDQSTFNRNKIRTNNRWGYLTVPIGRKTNGTRLCDIVLPTDNSWQRVHWQTIYRNYAHTDYFKNYKDFFEELYLRDFKCLSEINIEIILYLMKCFDINVEVYKASEINIDPTLPTTEFIIALLASVGANTYLSGPSGRDYLEIAKFPEHKMELKYFKHKHPVYQQRYPGFEPNMSAIDLLFNVGPQSARIINESGNIED